MNRSHMLMEGARSLAIYIILILLTIWLPFVSLITLFLIPIPFILFTNKHGLRAGGLLALFSFFLLFLITPLSLPITVAFVIGGVTIGELYRKGKHAFAVFLGGSLAFISALIFNYVGSILVLNINPIEALQNLFRESLEQTAEMLQVLGQYDEAVINSINLYIDHLSYIAPTIIIILGVVYAFIVQWLASLWMRKQKYQVTLFPPFREWSFPKVFIWYYLVTYIFVFIGLEEGRTMFIVLANLTPVLDIILMIQGLAFIFFFFHMKKKNKIVPIIITIILFLLPMLLYIVRIIGIIDLGFELRKRLNSQK
ncbi:YybS family protein [Evansella cellulosilytica]|uniref:DUF2232 domain-containing protein n=1 Tax=Evansella cellulosilytica (strain ATCC 21833 / DSM 2522 / FERM P-1141 / JCM 9156 / N-4) TaxID=649639 RepID=E6TZX3_EVAC2|nr:YybS family protein [Evansella cellulosilytica]ADU32539.1 Protein of unknown function DUF2232, membrane [Evansella cellulosilytica DSM 2522]